MEQFQKILKWVGIIIGIIGIVVGIIFVIVSFLTKDAVGVANQELAALRANNLDNAYYSHTSESLRETTSFETFKQIVETYPILKTNTNVRYTYKGISASEGVNLSGILSGPDNSRASIEIQLKKEGGSWKVFYLNVEPINN